MWSGLLNAPGSPAGQVQPLVQRSLSLPLLRPAASLWDSQGAEALPPPAVALHSPGPGQLPPVLEAAGGSSDGSCQPECSAPLLPAAENEASLVALEEAARAAAQLVGHAFSAAGMLNDAARLARASLSGQDMAAAQHGSAAQPVPATALQQQMHPLEQQRSRIPRPYLNY